MSDDRRRESLPPPPDFNGDVSIEYRACLPGRACRLGIMRIRVLPVNDAPTARNDLAVTESGATVTIDVLANDSDAEGDPLSILSVTDLDVGDARIVGRRVRWSPPEGFVGTASFRYTAADGLGGRASARVTVRVTGNPSTHPGRGVSAWRVGHPGAAPAETPTVAPVRRSRRACRSRESARPPAAGRADRLSVPEGGTVLIDVLANDSDPEGDALSIVSVGSPARGTGRKVGDRVQFTAPSDYVGGVTFPYTIADPRERGAAATVSVSVLLVNVPPVVLARSGSIGARGRRRCRRVSGWARDIDPGATSEVGQAVSFAVATDNSSLFAVQPGIGPSGTSPTRRRRTHTALQP